MNTILHLSGMAWLQAAVMALILLGLGLEGLGSDEAAVAAEGKK